jgi:hypothetical protein
MFTKDEKFVIDDDYRITYVGKDKDKVILPDDIKAIGSFSFDGDRQIKQLILNDGLKSINSYALANMSISELDVPSFVIEIMSYAFADCSNLSKVIFHDGLVALHMALFKGTAIKELEIPSSVSYISDFCFSECSTLKVLKFHIIKGVLRKKRMEMLKSVLENCKHRDLSVTIIYDK